MPLNSHLVSSTISSLPFLHPSLPNLPQDNQWLHEKLISLTAGFSVDTFTVELACAARLCVEEQLLDANKSTKSKGKYADKFHPTTPLPSTKWSNDYSTRPLTTGEISANWSDLYPMLLSKYKIDADHVISTIMEASHDTPLELGSVFEAVEDSEDYVYVHLPSGYTSICEAIIAELCDVCDVVDGGNLGDAVEYALKDSNCKVCNVYSTKPSELSQTSRDERNFPAKWWFVDDGGADETVRNEGIRDIFSTEISLKEIHEMLC